VITNLNSKSKLITSKFSGIQTTLSPSMPKSWSVKEQMKSKCVRNSKKITHKTLRITKRKFSCD
jgi:hypothetical protein